MFIHVCDWSRNRLLEKTPYRDSRDVGPIEGTLDDALKIAGDLLTTGLDVMLRKPHHDGENVDIWVDDRGFPTVQADE